MGIAGAAATTMADRSIALFEGETVGRVHLHYNMLYSPPVPLAPFGFEGVIGIRVQNDLSTVPALDPLDDISSDDWMFIEGFAPTAQVFDYRPTTGTEVEIYTAPTDGGYRDIKSQRKVTADGALWVQANTSFMGSNQGNFYAQFVISALIILP